MGRIEWLRRLTAGPRRRGRDVRVRRRRVTRARIAFRSRPTFVHATNLGERNDGLVIIVVAVVIVVASTNDTIFDSDNFNDEGKWISTK